MAKVTIYGYEGRSSTMNLKDFFDIASNIAGDTDVALMSTRKFYIDYFEDKILRNAKDIVEKIETDGEYNILVLPAIMSDINFNTNLYTDFVSENFYNTCIIKGSSIGPDREFEVCIFPTQERYEHIKVLSDDIRTGWHKDFFDISLREIKQSMKNESK